MRFSIRSLLVFVTLVCLLLSIVIQPPTGETLVNTGRELDIAVIGGGYLCFTNSSTKETVFCPSASLSLGRNYELVAELDGESWDLEPWITLPSDWQSVVFDPDGSVSVREAGSKDLTDFGVLVFARFDNPKGLISRGDGVFLVSEDSGSPTIGVATAGKQVVVCQGWVHGPSESIWSWVCSSPSRGFTVVAFVAFLVLISGRLGNWGQEEPGGEPGSGEAGSDVPMKVK